jgi:hypothetical protein
MRSDNALTSELSDSAGHVPRWQSGKEGQTCIYTVVDISQIARQNDRRFSHLTTSDKRPLLFMDCSNASPVSLVCHHRSGLNAEVSAGPKDGNRLLYELYMRLACV